MPTWCGDIRPDDGTMLLNAALHDSCSPGLTEGGPSCAMGAAPHSFRPLAVMTSFQRPRGQLPHTCSAASVTPRGGSSAVNSMSSASSSVGTATITNGSRHPAYGPAQGEKSRVSRPFERRCPNACQDEIACRATMINVWHAHIDDKVAVHVYAVSAVRRMHRARSQASKARHSRRE